MYDVRGNILDWEIGQSENISGLGSYRGVGM